MGGLTLAKVGYNRYLRFLVPFLGIMFVLDCAFVSPRRGLGLIRTRAVEQGSGGVRRLSVRQAAFIGVGAMVGAGIFSLLGAAGEVAGAAVWISFLIAGVDRRCCRATRSPSSARGTRRPAGCSSTCVRGFGNGHVTGVIAWLLLATNAIITAMVAVSFGSYAERGGRRRQHGLGRSRSRCSSSSS